MMKIKEDGPYFAYKYVSREGVLIIWSKPNVTKPDGFELTDREGDFIRTSKGQEVIYGTLDYYGNIKRLPAKDYDSEYWINILETAKSAIPPLFYQEVLSMLKRIKLKLNSWGV